MRAYNFVVQITPDFDDIQFRIRAIDFDQQFYEGNIKVYLPQFFKENFPYVKLGIDQLTDKTYSQYQQEEKSSLLHRVRSERHRLTDLRDVSNTEILTTTENVARLKTGMADYLADQQYLECKSMTDIIELNIKNIIRQVKLWDLKKDSTKKSGGRPKRLLPPQINALDVKLKKNNWLSIRYRENSFLQAFFQVTF